MQDNGNSRNEAALKSLAAVGFVALVGAGIWLAISAARYIPAVVGSIGSAAVSLSQIFTPNEGTPLSVGTTTPATSTETASSTEATSTPKTPAGTTYPGEKTSGTIAIGGTASTSPVKPYGLPDLAVTIDAVGYLTTNSTDSFVAAATVPYGMRPAVRFTVKNVGTNVAGAWRFTATIPTVSTYSYQSPIQQPLNPEDRIIYTLGFDQARYGANQPITIVANYDGAVAESTTQNDTAVANVTVLGS